MVVNSEKISRFLRCALRHALGAFLRDIGGKIAGIPTHNTEKIYRILKKKLYAQYQGTLLNAY